MRIIERGKEYINKSKYPVKETCEYCGSVIELDEDDLNIGQYGAAYYICPVCGERCMADNVDGITLTADNIDFPKHFNHSVDGVKLTKEDVKKYIKDGIKFFRENPDSFTYVTGSGNTGVMVLNYSGDEEYLVVVTKDYYDMNIPYEKEDYAVQDAHDWAWENKGINLKRQKVNDN